MLFACDYCHNNFERCPSMRSKQHKFCSNDCRSKWSKGKSMNAGCTNGNWAGNDVGYNGLHSYIGRIYQKPQYCEKCQIEKPRDLANKGVYDRNLKNWEWLCRKCHMSSDGRLDNLIALSKSRRVNYPAPCELCGRIFQTHSSKKRFCSLECYWKWSKGQPNARKGVTYGPNARTRSKLDNMS